MICVCIFPSCTNSDCLLGEPICSPFKTWIYYQTRFETGHWSGKQTVDNTSSSFTSLDVECNDVYISYYDVTNQNLKFAHSGNAGENWSNQTLDSTLNVGAFTSLATSGGNIYISYYDQSSSNLKMARSTNLADYWSTIDSNPNVDLETSMKVTGIESSIDVFNSIAFTGYGDSASPELRFAISLNAGLTW